MTRTRTDAHRPSTLDPAEYELAAEGDAHAEDGWIYWVIPEAGSLMEADTGHDYGQCQHCGQRRIRYFSIFLHVPTGEVLTVGQDCAAKLELDSRNAVQQKRDRKAREALAKRDAFLMIDDHLELTEWLADRAVNGRYNEFLSSLLAKFNRYGELTAKQVEALRKSKVREEEWAAERAAELADEPDPTPVPDTDDRIQITGKIISSKHKVTDFGERQVMTVLDDRGFKVWGTQPESLLVPQDRDAGGWIQVGDDFYRPADRGDRVSFTAKVERSDRDETFGFFKRPTKAEVVA